MAAAAIEGGKAIGKLDMRDILALFKRDAEFNDEHVDDAHDAHLYTKTRVLDDSKAGDEPGGESTADGRRKGRKAGSLGLRKPAEDSVWGRR